MNRTHLARLKAIIDRIEANPECWDQNVWHSECGTAHCIAGHAQIDSGRQSDWAYAEADGREWLGLDAIDADDLFAEDRSLEDIREFYQEKLDELEALEATQ